MIKHEIICDKCGKTETLKYNPKAGLTMNLPNNWESTGVCPVHHLCPECSFELNKIKKEVEFNFFNENKEGANL